MNKNKKEGKLHNRNKRISILYSNYLMSLTSDEIEKLFNESKFSNEQIIFINNILRDKDKLEKEILKYLPSNWKWDRFNYLERAVILNATAEILLAGNKKAIVIDESILYARKYCGEKSEPLINGIIDKIGNE